MVFNPDQDGLGTMVFNPDQDCLGTQSVWDATESTILGQLTINRIRTVGTKNLSLLQDDYAGDCSI